MKKERVRKNRKNASCEIVEKKHQNLYIFHKEYCAFAEAEGRGSEDKSKQQLLFGEAEGGLWELRVILHKNKGFCLVNSKNKVNESYILRGF